ncbi:MAG: Ribosomal RNA small subunit methyltransferase E [Syntrophus sp. PtaB.Bin001]|nr:MAG: Ribosomal RNA small subunit methyltransferase E [Syntrophus sp. PtaB.Bin001]
MGLFCDEKRNGTALTLPRLYYPSALTVGSICYLVESNLHYIRSVQRMKKGGRLSLFDGRGQEYTAVIVNMTTEQAILEILDKNYPPARPARITLFQALPKAQKMDFIIQKATELGVDEIRPFVSERSIPRLSAEKSRLKTERWRKIAQEAAKQCRRSDVPEVTEIVTLADILKAVEPGACKLIFWEDESRLGLRNALQRFSQTPVFSIIVGPEGGLTADEVAAATAAGFVSVSLGRQILKLETAAVAILAVLQYEAGFFEVESEN